MTPLNKSTCASPDGETYRQIDYILINRQYRNFVRETNPIYAWIVNMEQQRQHAVVKMELRLHFLGNYSRKPTQDTWAEITYNIKQARMQPGLLGKYMRGEQIHIV